MVTRDIRPGDSTPTQKKIPLLFLIILVLSVYWLLSFFGHPILRSIPHRAGFIEMLTIIIVILIVFRFLSWL